MSETRRYEDLLARIKVLEGRVRDLEAAREPELSEGEALGAWEAFLLAAERSAIIRCWRELETPDLHASSIGLSEAAKEKLRQSLSRNAWALLEEECALPGTAYGAHFARLRVLRIVRQLEEMGEISVKEKAPA